MYYDPLIKKYIDLFKANNADIQAYYQGDPILIPQSEMPALFAEKVETGARPHNNALDEHGIRIRMTLVTDVRKELSTNDSGDIVAGIARLYDILEGRNSDYTLKTSSILHILRNNIEVDLGNNLRTDLGTETSVDYSESLNRREQGWFIESRIEFIAYFLQTR